MRVAIVGNSGSGKSTLARKLATDAGTPTLDLDTVAWEPGKIAIARNIDDALADVRDFCSSADSWIVEGCYTRLIAEALRSGPLFLVLDPGPEQCASNCRSRPWERHKYSSKEEQDKHLAFLLQWVEEYYTRNDDMSLVAHKALYAGYDGPKQWLSTLNEVIQPVVETEQSNRTTGPATDGS